MIVIILVLAGLLLPAIQMARTQAEQARAREAVKQMAAAFRAYFSEFGRWPTPTNNSSYYAGGAPAGQADFYITTNLFANANGSTFYDYSPKDVVSNMTVGGTAYNGQSMIVDPWKNPYRCRLVTNYTGDVTDPLGGGTLYGWAYAIWSTGPDGGYDTGGDNSSSNIDNPRSW